MNVAIFIDGENISSKEYCPILDDIRKNGQVSISNVYLDWTENQSWKEVSKNFGITPIQCQKINGKNSVDLKIAVDIMETLYERQIDLFCILTTDSDFCHIVQKLKSRNKIVHIYGYENNINKSLLSICNQFINIKNLKTSDCMNDIDRYWNIIRYCVEEKNISNIGEIKSKIIQEIPSFDVKNYGVKRFLVFLKKYYKDKITFISNEKISILSDEYKLDLEKMKESLKENDMTVDKIQKRLHKKYSKEQIKTILKKNFENQIISINRKGEIKYHKQ
jgi:uncharacterized protein (TIGR00288 family)